MVILTNKFPLMINGDLPAFKSELMKLDFDKDTNTIPSGHVFKVDLVCGSDVYLTSKEFDYVVRVSELSVLFNQSEIEV